MTRAIYGGRGHGKSVAYADIYGTTSTCTRTISTWPVYTGGTVWRSVVSIVRPKEWRWFHRQPVCLVALRREKRKVWINAMRGAT